MGIQEMLFKNGVATWIQDIVTALPISTGSTGSSEFQIGKNLATNIGFIYGLSVYADGVDNSGATLISTTQAQNMYLSLADGGTQFVQYIRLSDLLNEFAGSPVVRPDKFTPLNVPVFDLSQSYYYNPNLYINATIRLKLWYIKKADFTMLKASGFFGAYQQQKAKAEQAGTTK